MAEWQQIELTIPGIDLLESVVGTLDSALAGVQPGIDAVLGFLRLISVFSGRTDPISAALRTALEQAGEAVLDLTGEAGGYVLVVPPIQPFLREPAAPRITVSEPGDVASIGLVAGPDIGQVGDGGNFGMYRKIVESLFDLGDFQRPQPENNAYVAGTVLVFGADNFGDLLSGILQLEAIFGSAIPLPLDGFALPVPQNVKMRPSSFNAKREVSQTQVIDARLFPHLESTAKTPFSAQITWDDVPVYTRTLTYGAFVYQVKKWHVYAKPDSKIKPGEDLSQYEVASFTMPSISAGGSVGEIEFNVDLETNANGILLTNLDPRRTFYVSAALSVDIIDEENEMTTAVAPAVANLSDQRRVRLEDQAQRAQFLDSIPPDWIGVETPLQVIPPIRQTYNQVIELVLQLIANFTDFENEFDSFINAVEANVENVSALIADLREQLANLGNLFNFGDSTIGIYAATFEGVGGVPFIVSTMKELFLDPRTQNRPPFDEGDEALAGMVFLAQGSVSADVQAFLSIMQALTGTAPGAGFTVLNNISRVPPGDETIYMDPGANPTDAEGAAPAPPEPSALSDLGLSDEDPC